MKKASYLEIAAIRKLLRGRERLCPELLEPSDVLLCACEQGFLVLQIGRERLEPGVWCA